MMLSWSKSINTEVRNAIYSHRRDGRVSPFFASTARKTDRSVCPTTRPAKKGCNVVFWGSAVLPVVRLTPIATVSISTKRSVQQPRALTPCKSMTRELTAVFAHDLKWLVGGITVISEGARTVAEVLHVAETSGTRHVRRRAGRVQTDRERRRSRRGTAPDCATKATSTTARRTAASIRNGTFQGLRPTSRSSASLRLQLAKRSRLATARRRGSVDVPLPRLNC